MFTVKEMGSPVGSTCKHAVDLCWIKANAVFLLFIPSFSFSPSTNVLLAKKLEVAL